jgi:hypothetical protein
MKVLGLDDKYYNWNPKSNKGKRSKLHNKVRKFLDSCFPHDRILEEVTLAGTKKPSSFGGLLRADFWLPLRSIIVEANGEQHFKFNSFHFKRKLDFFRAQARDRDKAYWCEINDIKLVNLNFNETEEEWREKI